MRLRRRLLRLLREEGFAANDAVGEALDEFLAVVAGENTETSDDDDAPDDEADDGDDDDGTDDDADAGADDEAFAAGVRHIACPHCGERIALAIDLSGEGQDAIQDCEVCCSPIHVVYTVHAGKLASFHTEPA